MIQIGYKVPIIVPEFLAEELNSIIQDSLSRGEEIYDKDAYVNPNDILWGRVLRNGNVIVEEFRYEIQVNPLKIVGALGLWKWKMKYLRRLEVI